MIGKNKPDAISNGWKKVKPSALSQGIVQWIEESAMGIVERGDKLPLVGQEKNLVPYEFPFVSGISGLSHTEREYIQEHLWKDAVKARIYCIRHGMSVEEKRGKGLQGDESPLCGEAKGQYARIRKELQTMGVNEKNVYLLYSEWTRGKQVMRVIGSAEILREWLWIASERIYSRVDWLDTTDKDNDNETNRKLRTATISSDFTLPLSRALRDTDIENINIICIVHKSNIAAIEETLFGNWKHDIHINSRSMKPGGMITFDFDRSWEPVDYEKNQWTLKLWYDAYREVMKALHWEEGLHSIFHSFKAWEIQLWELQNYVNAYFIGVPELYERYFIRGDTHLSIWVFCLANLIRMGRYDIIEKFYMSWDCMALPREEKEVLLENVKDEKVMGIFRRIFVSRGKVWGEDNKNLIETSLERGIYEDLKAKRELYEGILKSSDTRSQSIFENSLDTLVKIQQWLIPRWLYTFQKKSEEEVKKLQEEKKGNLSKEDTYDKISMNLRTLLNSPSLVHILLGHVWDGKSTELARMKSEIDTDSKYESFVPLFYSARENSTNSIDKITEDIKVMREVSPEKQIVVFFDGIDELDGSIREKLVTYLKEINRDIHLEGRKIRVIMGSRPSGFDRYWDGNIHFESIPQRKRKEFLFSRLQSLKKDIPKSSFDIESKLQEIEIFLTGNILDEDLKNTPLILYFLCEISVGDENSKGLSHIRNRADLYEEMISRILAKHQWNAKAKNTKLDDTNDKLLFETLGYCAYQKHINSGQPLRSEDVELYLKDEQWIKSEVSRKEILNQIFLLYKLEEEWYEFILKSFEEYFLARYLAEENCGEQKIYDFRDTKVTGNWNDWREFRPVVMFYGEMLINNEEWDKLGKFLWEDGILKNDDMFGENFFMGLEILYKLPESVRTVGPIKWILKRYVNKVSQLNSQEIMQKFESIKKFLKGTGYRDTDISDIVFGKMQNIIENSNANYDIFLEILEIGTSDAVSYVAKWAQVLMEYREPYHAWEVYDALGKVGNPWGNKRGSEMSTDTYEQKWVWCSKKNLSDTYKNRGCRDNKRGSEMSTGTYGKRGDFWSTMYL